MKDVSSDIEVVVQPYRSPKTFNEFVAAENTPLYTGKENECYIVAIPDQRYKVTVKFPERFDFMGAPAADIDVKIDGGVVHEYRVLENLESKRHHDMTERKREVTIDSFYALVDGQSRSFGLTFGEIKICRKLQDGESLNPTDTSQPKT